MVYDTIFEDRRMGDVQRATAGSSSDALRWSQGYLFPVPESESESGAGVWLRLAVETGRGRVETRLSANVKSNSIWPWRHHLKMRFQESAW